MEYGFKSFEMDASAFKPSVTVEELRIGNYLQSYTTWLTGDRSEKKALGPCRVDIKTLQMILDNPPLVTMEPIPLTPGILLKCGFIPYGDGWRIGAYWFMIEPECEGVEGFYFRPIDAYMKRIEYLHQLQNLYFALTDDELEINL